MGKSHFLHDLGLPYVKLKEGEGNKVLIWGEIIDVHACVLEKEWTQVG